MEVGGIVKLFKKYKDTRLLDLEDLDINDYNIIIDSLYCCFCAKLLHIKKEDYNNLLIKLQNNLDRLIYNNQFSNDKREGNKPLSS